LGKSSSRSDDAVPISPGVHYEVPLPLTPYGFSLIGAQSSFGRMSEAGKLVSAQFGGRLTLKNHIRYP
ncbi:hypothetical protein ACC687_40375, partial [Rhizobium ruizarguesonis]